MNLSLIYFNSSLRHQSSSGFAVHLTQFHIEQYEQYV